MRAQMGRPITIRLDEDLRCELEAGVRSRGVGLAALIRDLVTEAAREARRARIREASAAVGAHAAASAEGRAFYEEWGAQQSDGG